MNAASLRRGLRTLIQNTGTDVSLVSRPAGTYSTTTGQVSRPTPVTTPTRVAVTDFTNEILSGTAVARGHKKLLVSAELCPVTPQKGDRVTGLGGPVIVMSKKDFVMGGVFLGWILICGGEA
jgi:hypothetical protein